LCQNPRCFSSALTGTGSGRVDEWNGDWAVSRSSASTSARITTLYFCARQPTSVGARWPTDGPQISRGTRPAPSVTSGSFPRSDGNALIKRKTEPVTQEGRLSVFGFLDPNDATELHAGGGTRTPDTRIMIPPLFGSVEPNLGGMAHGWRTNPDPELVGDRASRVDPGRTTRPLCDRRPVLGHGRQDDARGRRLETRRAHH
jgi:hypothetical protein